MRVRADGAAAALVNGGGGDDDAADGDSGRKERRRAEGHSPNEGSEGHEYDDYSNVMKGISVVVLMGVRFQVSTLRFPRGA
jgi:hypothetical protein